MKLFAALLVIAAGISANAMTWTERVELRDTITNSNSLPSASNGGSASSTLNVGAGLTADVWTFYPSWSIFSGGMLRQRTLAFTLQTNGTSGINYTYLDIPVELNWDFYQGWAVRAGVNIGIKIAEVGNGNTNNLSDNGVVFPPELAFDWHFMGNHMASLGYEFGTALANGSNGTNNYSTNGVAVLAYGYSF
jgi:hypothetical protein